jgi:hypothetical protein
LHLTYIPEKNSFDVHLDTRQHISQDISTHLSQGVEDLYKFLTSQPTSIDQHLEKLRLALAKQCLAIALFRTASKINSRKENFGYTPMFSKQAELRRRKLKKTRKHLQTKRKYKLKEDIDTLYIEDWESFSPKSQNPEKDRQQDK